MAVWSGEGRTTREPDAPACLPVISSRAVAVRAGRTGRYRPTCSFPTNRARLVAGTLDADALRSPARVIEAANRL